MVDVQATWVNIVLDLTKRNKLLLDGLVQVFRTNIQLASPRTGLYYIRSYSPGTASAKALKSGG
jgi:hypothetical protein